MVGRKALAALAGVALACACAAGVDPADREPELPIHRRIHVPSIAACGGCHQAVYAEWARSLHARAWTNANARTATVIVDFGLERGVDSFRVATEVARNADGTAAGISIGDVMGKILNIPFET